MSATAKTARSDLRAKTIAVDGATLDIASVPRGALLLLNRSDEVCETVLARRDVIRVADVSEVAEPQQYWVIRTCCGQRVTPSPKHAASASRR